MCKRLSHHDLCEQLNAGSILWTEKKPNVIFQILMKCWYSISQPTTSLISLQRLLETQFLKKIDMASPADYSLYL